MWLPCGQQLRMNACTAWHHEVKREIVIVLTFHNIDLDY